MAATPTAPIGENHQIENDLVVAEAISRLHNKERVRRRIDLILSIGTPVALVILWQVSADAHLIDPRIFTPPTTTTSYSNFLLFIAFAWQATVARAFRSAQ